MDIVLTLKDIIWNLSLMEFGLILDEKKSLFI